MVTLLSGLPAKLTCLDDTTVTEIPVNDLCNRWTRVLQSINDSELCLRKERCQFFPSKRNYLCSTLFAYGLFPDSKNAESVQHVLAPKDVPSFRTHLGLIGYQRTFNSDLQCMHSQLNKILQKKQTWYRHTGAIGLRRTDEGAGFRSGANTSRIRPADGCGC